MHKCHDDVKGLSCLRSRNCRSATYSGSAEDRYRRAVAACRQLGLPLTICTIYNGCFPDAEDLDHCKLAVLNSLGSSACAAFTNTPSIILLRTPEPRLALNRIVVVRYRMHLESRGLAANTIACVCKEYAMFVDV